ncbi:MAG: hypothetical protein ACE5IQ_05605 [Candidatus Methylomirabilales bacterium]
MNWHERLRLTLKRSPILWAVPLGIVVVIALIIAINRGPTDMKTALEKLEKKEERVKAQIVDSCKQIRLGMPKAELLTMMPKPVGTISYRRQRQVKEKLLFPSRAGASTPPTVVVDQRTGHVEEVVCDANYRLPPKPPKP